MSTFTDIKRELFFLLQQKNTLILLTFAFALSTFSVTTGLLEINKQQQTIQRLVELDKVDRQGVLDKYTGYGSQGYYSKHLVYSTPSNLAFAAIGQRDVMAWKHRIKILALEGQIYETDAGNPELAYVGRIDFAFIISVLAPLLVILLLHDIRASERDNGRYDLLLTTSKHPNRLWLIRAFVGAFSLTIVLIAPFVISAFIADSQPVDTLIVSLICAGQIAFWAIVCHWVGKVSATAPKLATMLLGIWLLTTIIIPVAGDKFIAYAVETPKGGDIVLAQREAVNAAWDLPHERTFEPFIKRHPQWRNYVEMSAVFDWKWYFAFQQVGDQSVEEMSQSYRNAIIRKNELAGIVAWLSPAMLVQRSLTRTAHTDTLAMLEYEQSIRDFHTELRQFYYPFLFKGIEYKRDALKERPEFRPRIN